MDPRPVHPAHPVVPVVAVDAVEGEQVHVPAQMLVHAQAREIETDPNKIYQLLIEQLKIEKKYDKEEDVTKFDIIFPNWLYENYEKDTVKTLCEIVQKNVVTYMANDFGKSPILSELVFKDPDSIDK